MANCLILLMPTMGEINPHQVYQKCQHSHASWKSWHMIDRIISRNCQHHWWDKQLAWAPHFRRVWFLFCSIARKQAIDPPLVIIARDQFSPRRLNQPNGLHGENTRYSKLTMRVAKNDGPWCIRTKSIITPWCFGMFLNMLCASFFIFRVCHHCRFFKLLEELLPQHIYRIQFWSSYRLLSAPINIILYEIKYICKG